MTEIEHKKEPFVLQDSTDNTKKLKFDLSSLNTGTTSNLIVSDLSNGNNILRTSNRDSYRLLAILTSTQNAPVNTLVKLNLQSSSDAWDNSNNHYVVQKSGLYSITLNVSLNSAGGSNAGVGALASIVVGDTVGSNNAAFFGSRVNSHSERDYVNCFIEQIYLNANEVIEPWGYSFAVSRNFMALNTSDGPHNGTTLYTYMTVQYVGDI